MNMSSDSIRPQELLDRLEGLAPRDDAKLTNTIAALRVSVEQSEREVESMRERLAEFEEAYQKLTAPANRIGIFLRHLNGEQVLIALGDTEYVALVDPALDPKTLTPGSRIRLNEAYAIVGLVEPAGNGTLLKVAEVLADGRLRIGTDTPGLDGRLVDCAPELTETTIQPGDSVRLDPTGRIAIEHFPQTESRDYFFEDVPEIPWENVGGQKEAIQLIRDTIEQPLLHPEIFAKYEKKPIKGILLYGPPGCGKTLIGKATAYNLAREYEKVVGHPVKEYFMAISGPKILNMWLGETERMVREIFRTAREKAKEGRLVFIFMDEAESVLRTRSSGRWLNISNTVVPQFCAELDGLVSLDNVVLILTSNRPDYIDPAVLRPERIDRKVKVSRPDEASAKQILGIYLHANIPLDPDLVAHYQGELDCVRKELVEQAVQYLWRAEKDAEFLNVVFRSGNATTLYQRDLVSGALLKSVVDRAKDYAIRRAIENPSAPNGITLADLKLAIDQEYKENEIFPKSDSQDDWLKLLDYEPDNVAAVRPIGKRKGEELVRKSII